MRVERSFFSNFQNFIFYQSLPRSLNENRSRPFHKPYLFDSIKLLSLRLANILKNKTEIFRKKTCRDLMIPRKLPIGSMVENLPNYNNQMLSLLVLGYLIVDLYWNFYELASLDEIFFFRSPRGLSRRPHAH